MRDVLTGLAKRRLEGVVEARLAEEPVVVLNGPRTVGKSTLLSELAGRLGRAGSTAMIWPRGQRCAPIRPGSSNRISPS